MKKKITKLFYPLLITVCMLFIAALIIGLHNGIVPQVLLIVAVTGAFVLLLEATWTKQSFFKYSYRFAIFWGLWAAYFYSRDDGLLVRTFGVLTAFSVFCILGSIMYYLNKYCVPDADAHLDD